MSLLKYDFQTSSSNVESSSFSLDIDTITISSRRNPTKKAKPYIERPDLILEHKSLKGNAHFNARDHILKWTDHHQFSMRNFPRWTLEAPTRIQVTRVDRPYQNIKFKTHLGLPPEGVPSLTHGIDGMIQDPQRQLHYDVASSQDHNQP